MAIASSYIIITDSQKESTPQKLPQKSLSNSDRPGLLTLLRWIADLTIHLVFVVIPRRLRDGPKLPSWTFIHEILVESMQFSYRWHITDSSTVLANSPETTDLPLAYAEYFQNLISYAPLPPYFPFAVYKRINIDCRLFLRDQKFIQPLLLNSNLQTDIVTTLKIKNTKTVNGMVVSSKKAVLMIHGGAFNFRMEATWRPVVASLSNSTQSTFIIPHYRLAPQFPFPCGLYDVLCAYLQIIIPESDGGFGYDPSQVVFMGESAGGGLVISLCLLLKQLQLPRPRCLYLISPWLDLTCETSHHHFLEHGDTPCREKTGWDRFYPNDLLHKPTFPFDLSLNYARWSILHPHSVELEPSYKNSSKNEYSTIRDLALRHPLVSPIFASTNELKESLPPFLIQLGGSEYLLDEGLALFRRVNPNSKIITTNNSSYSGVDESVCEVYPHMTHIFPFMMPLGERSADLALKRAAEFVNRSFDI